MTALYDRLPVIQRTPAWLEARDSGIGASEAAAAIGLDEYTSRYALWCRKLQLAAPVEETIPMRLGSYLEPLIADLYQERTGHRVRRVNQLLRSREHPWMLASLDRRRDDGRLLEMKWSARATGYGEDGTDEVPDRVLCQAMHQAAVVGADVVDIAVLTGSSDFRIYTVRRDTGAEALLIAREQEFWRSVETRTEPALDGSDSTLQALRDRYPRDNGASILAGADAAEALAALGSVRAAIATHEENERRLRAVIEAAMGDATELVAPGVGRVSWKAPKDSVSTDWKGVAADLREALVESGVEPAVVALIENAHTTTKPASRRFVPRWEDTVNG